MKDKHMMMESLARAAHEKGSFNGTWLYAEKGEIVSKGALGFRDPEDTLPIAEDTIFQLASVSKTFTAAAVMLVVREGKLGLEDEITKYFPEIPYPGVTVRHLLNHTSGIPDYFDDADWFINIWQEEKRVPGNDEILRFLRETEAKPYFAPGEGLHYSNTGFNLLALLVERLSGVPYEEFLRKNIFEPAGMTSTRCCHIRRDGVPFENYARATVFEEDGRCVADVDSAEDGDVVAFDGLNGDDYVFTNIFDMLRWDRALREGRVLTPEEQRLMYSPGKLNNGEDAVYDEDDGLGYGFGWAVGRDEDFGLVVSHSGGMPGVATWFERFLDADRVLVILGSRDYRDARAYLSYWDGMEAAARDKEPEPVVSIEDIEIKDPDRSKWESFCGKYEHPEDGDFTIDEIYMEDGELYANAIDDEDDELNFRLYPTGENEFGRKRGLLKLSFGDGCLMFDGHTCKKL
jgi:CubicO group peptidase (beta-lactamase class C family)